MVKSLKNAVGNDDYEDINLRFAFLKLFAPSVGIKDLCRNLLPHKDVPGLLGCESVADLHALDEKQV